MYRAKQEGKARYEVFDPAVNALALERLELERDLQRAVEVEEFRLYYQPEILLEGGRIVGFETLLRWDRPGHGLVSPRSFIPVAEETGLIVPIGRWVLREACRKAREWQVRYPQEHPLVVSVNLSAKQFQQPDLTEAILWTLAETGLEPQCLQLEVTESVVMRDVRRAAGVLRELKKAGVRLAIDDFGTGYSSMNVFKHFPVDDLKIDRSFLDEISGDVEPTAMLQMMVDLAHALGMRAVGEGVENAEQLEQLREMGCDKAQGYYIAKPLPEEAMSRLLAGIRN